MASRRGGLSRFLNPKVEAAGIEVGTSAIKVVELRAGAVPTLSAMGTRAMPPGLIQDDQVVDPAGLAEEVKSLLQEAGVKNRRVVTAVSNQQAVTRNIFVPKMSLQELNEAIKWEAERYIPFPIDEVVLDYFVLDNPEDVEEGGQLEVVIAAARTDLVGQQVEYLQLAGLEPLVIDIKPFTLLRSLRGSLLGERLAKETIDSSNYTESLDVGVVVEIAASNTTITLVRGARVLMNRNIAVSGDDFTAAIQTAFGLDFDGAEEVKIDYGTASVDSADAAMTMAGGPGAYSPAQVYEAIRPVLVDLTTEVRRSLEFFRVQAGEAEIDRMVLAGGGAKLRGLAEAIGDSLGLRVELANPWLTVNVDENRFDPERLRQLGPEFAVPLGLALRGVRGID